MSGILTAAAGHHGTATGGVVDPPPVIPPGPLSVYVAPNPCLGVAGNAPPAAPDVGLIEHALAVTLNGTPPFTYAWTWVSGTPAALWGMTPPNVAEVWWSFQTSDHREAVYRVTVTDSLGAVATGDVTIIAN
jgi:hypothetical protein